MLTLSKASGQLIGTVNNYDELHAYILKNQAFLTTSRSRFQSLNPAHLNEYEAWRFTHYSYDELCILYMDHLAEDIPSKGLLALENGCGLLEIMYGDTNILSQVQVTCKVDIEDYLAGWCTRYCTAHDLIVTVKPDTGDDDDLLV